MARLPPFVAKLIASDGYEEKKYFETKAAAEKWALSEGKEKFDGDIERAEIHEEAKGLIWSKDQPKRTPDIRYLQMQQPDSILWHTGIPKKKAAPGIEAYCETCRHQTLNWREYEERYGIPLTSKPLLRCSECYKVVSDNASRPETQKASPDENG